LQDALALAGKIAANAPLSTLMTKRIIQESPGWAEDEIWERQRPLTESVLASEDAQEGARAFAEKRAPDWKGK
jgi:enoyl-CoA hydratase